MIYTYEKIENPTYRKKIGIISVFFPRISQSVTARFPLYEHLKHFVQTSFSRFQLMNFNEFLKKRFSFIYDPSLPHSYNTKQITYAIPKRHKSNDRPAANLRPINRKGADRHRSICKIKRIIIIIIITSRW